MAAAAWAEVPRDGAVLFQRRLPCFRPLSGRLWRVICALRVGIDAIWYRPIDRLMTLFSRRLFGSALQQRCSDSVNSRGERPLKLTTPAAAAVSRKVTPFQCCLAGTTPRVTDRSTHVDTSAAG